MSQDAEPGRQVEAAVSEAGQWSSADGFGPAAPAPGINPVIAVGAAFVGGLLLARLVSLRGG